MEAYMFRVLVVDDEPAATEYISNLIRLKCPDLTVAATAENGEDGLRKFAEEKPDLIISDVKMPVMDGLQMVKAIKETKAEVPIVLVSGYQEFEYVREALKYGVSDYMLKPMTPAGFMAAMEPVIRLLEQRVYEQRKKLVRSMIAGETFQKEMVWRYFPEKRYYLAVIRENGLPRRFSDASEIELISELENTMFIYGRDEREALYICPEKVVSRTKFTELVENEAKRKQTGGNFVTAVLMPSAVETEELGNAVGRLYRELNGRLSVGVTQTFFVKEEDEQPERDREDIYEKESLRKIERYLEKGEYRQIQEEVLDFLRRAEEKKVPQLYLERMIHQIGLKVQQYCGRRSDIFEEEILFEDAFYDAGTTEELFESLKSILSRYWKKDKEGMKVDSPEFLETIQAYIRDHLSSELTVASLCREFGLSQSYLNLLFRKYGMESFNTYLRTARIERAKEIMERNPQMFIKDVAVMTGYRDQFYFSRIFRAVTGRSPSEYVDQLGAKGGKNRGR